MAEENREEKSKKIPMIQVKNLYKVYKVGDTKVYALGGVDFTIYKGEFCAIVGPSGSGKSTLLNMMAGLEKPSKGEILIAGKHIEKLTENQLVAFRRKHVGFIFQSYNLLQTMNAVENVALPLSFRGVPRKKRNEKAVKYIKLVGLEKQMKHMANEMSGGQQQRVGIARAWPWTRRSYSRMSLPVIWIRRRRRRFWADEKDCAGAESDACHGNP